MQQDDGAGKTDQEAYGPVSARFYDAAYAALPGLGADVDFYRGLARETGGPVLELGCGTGRVLAALAGDGHACTGLDASREMLAVGERHLPQTVALHVADMRAFSLPGRRFALIYSAFRAFQHLLAVEDQLRCLARVREHLAPGGCFAFDVFLPDLGRLAVEEEPEAEDLRFEQDGQLVVRHARVVRDLPTQSMRVHFRYERREGDRIVGEDRAAFGMRWFHRYELEHLLARAGFGEVRIYGGFDRSPIGRDSNAFVVVARRSRHAVRPPAPSSGGRSRHLVDQDEDEQEGRRAADDEPPGRRRDDGAPGAPAEQRLRGAERRERRQRDDTRGRGHDGRGRRARDEPLRAFEQARRRCLPVADVRIETRAAGCTSSGSGRLHSSPGRCSRAA